jgi:hypothetical protein
VRVQKEALLATTKLRSELGVAHESCETLRGTIAQQQLEIETLEVSRHAAVRSSVMSNTSVASSAGARPAGGAVSAAARSADDNGVIEFGTLLHHLGESSSDHEARGAGHASVRRRAPSHGESQPHAASATWGGYKDASFRAATADNAAAGFVFFLKKII